MSGSGTALAALFMNAYAVTGRGSRRGSGDGSSEPFPPRVTTTQRLRVGTLSG